VHAQQRAVERRKGHAARHRHVPGQFGLQHLHDALDALSAVGGQPPDDGPPDQHRGGAERQSLEDVSAPAESAIGEHRHTMVDDRDEAG
jgi:hypothetical protein